MSRVASLLGIACLIGLTPCACERQESTLLTALQQTWQTDKPGGGVEQVRFDGSQVRFAFGTEEEVACPYRITSFSDKESNAELRWNCKPRTGSDAWIDYSLQFDPDLRRFELRMGGRLQGVFRLAG